MIKPKKNIFFKFALNFFLDYKFKQRISIVNYFYGNKPIDSKIEGIEHDSIVLIGNHSTWWDGFLGWQMNRKLLQKDYFVMILEENLKKLWFFPGIGGFSIDPGSRSIVESLNFASNILKNPKSLIQFFPQGRLYSMHQNKITFHKGLAQILRNNPNISIIFYAMFFDFGSNEKPYLNVFIEKVTNAQQFTLEELNKKYQDLYTESLSKHVDFFNP